MPSVNEDFKWITKAHRSDKGWVFTIGHETFFLNRLTGNVSLIKSHITNSFRASQDANAFTGTISEGVERRYSKRKRESEF